MAVAQFSRVSGQPSGIPKIEPRLGGGLGTGGLGGLGSGGGMGREDEIEEGSSVGGSGEARWVDGSEVGLESPEHSFLREDESRDGFELMRKRLAKKPRRLDSFDVEAMEIAGAGAHRHSKSLFLLALVVSLFTTGQVVHGWFHRHGHAPAPRHAPSHGHAYPDFFRHHKRIFVFGDSYADTGNSRTSEESWKVPYGMTFPGHPSGRYSNGLVLTDFFARHFGGVGPGPIPFQQWRKVRRLPILYLGSLLSGMNFAHGGTGVFDTEVSAPNMTAQIDLFEQVVNKHYGDIGLENSIALVTNSGNDYTAYLARNNGTLNATDVMNFIGKVTTQLAINLKRIQALGVKKIAVANLQALQCVPRVTKSYSYKQCDSDLILELVDFHNMDVSDLVGDLNQENNTFVILDLFQAFVDVLQGKDYQSRFPEALKGCCMGTTSEGYCAVVDEHWKPMYTVCADPQRSFFWDMVHPTQAGWEAVFERLLPTLKLLE